MGEQQATARELQAWLRRATDELSSTERRALIDQCLAHLPAGDLLYLTNKLNDLKRDFIGCLPLELVELILGHLDAASLFRCCHVSVEWNRRLCTSFNSLWFAWCQRLLALAPSSGPTNGEYTYHAELDYRQLLVASRRRVDKLQRGSLFATSKLSPIESSVIVTHNNVLVTGISTY